MKKPRKPFEWKGRCWLSLYRVRQGVSPSRCLWTSCAVGGGDDDHVRVEVTIREIKPRRKR